MSFIAAALIGAGGALLGGALGAHGAQSAANTQASAANHATDVQQQMFQTLNDQQAPWRQAGQSALGAISGGFGLGPSSGGVDSGYFNHQFGASDLNANLAPNYQFMLDQGLGATTNLANKMGGLGGNALAGVAQYATGYAGQGYQQAYNNYTNNQTNIYNRLASIAGLGQTAGSNAATGASNFAQGIAGSIQGAGNAGAAGQVGVANALGGAVSGATGWYSLANMLGNNAGSSNAYSSNAAGGVTIPPDAWGGST